MRLMSLEAAHNDVTETQRTTETLQTSLLRIQSKQTQANGRTNGP